MSAKKILFRAVAVFLGMALSLLVAEVALRLVGFSFRVGALAGAPPRTASLAPPRESLVAPRGR